MEADDGLGWVADLLGVDSASAIQMLGNQQVDQAVSAGLEILSTLYSGDGDSSTTQTAEIDWRKEITAENRQAERMKLFAAYRSLDPSAPADNLYRAAFAIEEEVFGQASDRADYLSKLSARSAVLPSSALDRKRPAQFMTLSNGQQVLLAQHLIRSSALIAGNPVISAGGLNYTVLHVDDPQSKKPRLDSTISQPLMLLLPQGIPATLQQTGMRAEDTEGMEAHEEERELFVEYRVKKLGFGRPHQDHVVEALSMASVDPPHVTYQHHLPRSVIESGALSNLQLESVVYAGQRHEVLLPDGVTRAGFFIGDGAGVGKGREIAGIIYDNWRQDRKRALWFSISSDLIFDAKRDLKDISANIPIELVSKFSSYDARSLEESFPEGILFCTYNCLIAQNAYQQRRLDQLVGWCGEGFDGPIIFDEAHRAKNLVPERGMEPTRTGKAVLELQQRLPNARVVYVSATGASEVRNCAYMTRLGLWGPNLAFPTFEHFMEQIERGGYGAMEMVALNMKALGMYLSRSLSFKGVHFSLLEHKLSTHQQNVYNNSARLWQTLWRQLETAMMSCDCNRRVILPQFWGRHQSFFRQMLIAFKVPTLIKEIEAALSAGKCAVIGLLSTGEARTAQKVQKSVAASEDLDSFVSPPQEILTSLIEQYFPTTRGGVPVPEAVAAKKQLLEAVAQLGLPPNPLDAIIDHFGVDNVAEMTGRRARFIRDPKGGARYVPRSSPNVSMEMVNIHEKDLFVQGKKRVAIISEAASSGISLHADRRFQNQQPRMHFILELPWSSDKMIQQPPEYVLMITDIGGERRFASAVAKRLQTLGALTKGDRRAAAGTINFADFNFETKEGSDALHQMYFSTTEGKPVQGVTPPFSLAEARQQLELVGLPITQGNIVKRFFNRILGLETGWQNAFFNYFCSIFDKLVSDAKKTGQLDEGIMDMKAASIKLISSKTVHTDPATGAVTTHFILQAKKALSWEDALQIYKVAAEEPTSGFYRQRRSSNIILATRIPNSNIRTNPDDSLDYTGEYYYRIQTPARGHAAFKLRASILFDKYEKTDEKTAEVRWRQDWEEAQKRVEEVHVLGGSVLPFWGLFEKYLQNKYERVTVLRLQTDDGHRVVGVHIPTHKVNLIIPNLAKHFEQQLLEPDEPEPQPKQELTSSATSSSRAPARPRAAQSYQPAWRRIAPAPPQIELVDEDDEDLPEEEQLPPELQNATDTPAATKRDDDDDEMMQTIGGDGEDSLVIKEDFSDEDF